MIAPSPPRERLGVGCQPAVGSDLRSAGHSALPPLPGSCQSYRSMMLQTWGFPGGSVGKESACNAGDPGSIPGSGRSPGEGMETHSNSLA